MSVKDTYKSVAKESNGIYKEKGSKFIAYLYPVQDENDIKKVLDILKEKYHDARHHCYAWRLGPKGEPYRANDDGEPSNSAGKPILGQLLSYEISDCIIVVVRYFGGTKLGVGGLISAYKIAAEEAIRANSIIEKIISKNIRVQFNYKNMNEMMNLVKQLKLEVLDRDFQSICNMTLRVRLSDYKKLTAKLERTFGIEWEDC